MLAYRLHLAPLPLALSQAQAEGRFTPPARQGEGLESGLLHILRITDDRAARIGTGKGAVSRVSQLWLVPSPAQLNGSVGGL